MGTVGDLRSVLGPESCRRDGRRTDGGGDAGRVRKKAGGLTAQQQDLRQRCERREYRQGQGDPGLAMQCLGAMAGPKGVSVKSFRKIACEKAEGKPGYVCDYTMALDMATGPNVPPSLSRMASQPQQCTRRFVKSDAGWVLTTSDCR